MPESLPYLFEDLKPMPAPGDTVIMPVREGYATCPFTRSDTRKWWAVLRANPAAYGRFERDFLRTRFQSAQEHFDRAPFDFYVALLNVGDIIEIAADIMPDFNTGIPERIRRRVYGKVLILNDSKLQILCHDRIDHHFLKRPRVLATKIQSDFAIEFSVDDCVKLHHILHCISLAQGAPMEWVQMARELMQLLENVAHQWITASRPPVDPVYSSLAFHSGTLVRDALRTYQAACEKEAEERRMAEFDLRWQCHACGKDGERWHSYCGWCGEHRKMEK